MEAFAKYISWILVVIVAIHGAVTTYLPDNKKLAWLNAKKWRIVFCHSSILAAVFTILASYLGDMSSESRQRDLDNKLHNTQEALNEANRKVDDANKKLDESLKTNKGLLGLVSEQSKSISSLVFNMETSLEGKYRFAQNFETLSILSKFDDEQMEYFSQICSDGVAVFWFVKNTEKLKGFYFFSNAEINSILSSKPLDEDFLSNNGKVIIGEDKELFAAYSNCLLQKMPNRSNSAVVQLKASGVIDVKIKELLYYAYRAIPGSAQVRAYQYQDKPLLSGDRRVEFSYYVNPINSNSVTRCVSLDLSKDFVEGLYGLTRKEFNERVIQKFRDLNLEAKVTPKTIRYCSYKEVERVSGSLSRRMYPIQSSIRPDVSRYMDVVVGYNNTEIKKGINRVSISFRPSDVFPTLAVLNFHPEKALVGDVISLYLDGRKHSYMVNSWDEDKKEYSLISDDVKRVEKTCLSQIPLVGNIEIVHKSDDLLNVSVSGLVGGEYIKDVKSWDVYQYDKTELPKGISVEFIGEKGMQ